MTFANMEDRRNELVHFFTVFTQCLLMVFIDITSRNPHNVSVRKAPIIYAGLKMRKPRLKGS